MDSALLIRPFRPEDREQLVANAAADGHGVYFPTFVLEKQKEIVGYFSISVPVILTWQDSKKMKPMDSVQEISFIEGLLVQSPFICFPCDPESPYMRFLPKFGYLAYTKPVTLFIKTK